MNSKLFGPAPTVGAQHFEKRCERMARAAVNEQLRIVNEFAAAFLQFVHERVFFVGIKRLIEAAEFEQVSAARKEIAEDEFFFTGGADAPHAGITRAARPERKPAREHDGEHLFQRRRGGRAKIRTADHFHGGGGKKIFGGGQGLWGGGGGG